MSPEERKLLERSVSLSEDNNNMLRSMRRSMRWARIMSFLYWALIVGSAIGAYYYIQPYIDRLMSAYNSANNVLQSFKQ